MESSVEEGTIELGLGKRGQQDFQNRKWQEIETMICVKAWVVEVHTEEWA